MFRTILLVMLSTNVIKLQEKALFSLLIMFSRYSLKRETKNKQELLALIYLIMVLKLVTDLLDMTFKMFKLTTTDRDSQVLEVTPRSPRRLRAQQE